MRHVKSLDSEAERVQKPAQCWILGFGWPLWTPNDNENTITYENKIKYIYIICSDELLCFQAEMLVSGLSKTTLRAAENSCLLLLDYRNDSSSPICHNHTTSQLVDVGWNWTGPTSPASNISSVGKTTLRWQGEVELKKSTSNRNLILYCIFIFPNVSCLPCWKRWRTSLTCRNLKHHSIPNFG